MLGAHVNELIAGPLRPGSTTQLLSSTAPNSARVLQWMIVILEDYTRRVFHSKAYAEEVGVVTFNNATSPGATGNCLGYTYADAESNSLVLVAAGVISLLSHKDVSVREAAVTLSAQLFSLDVLHCGKVLKFNLCTCNDQDRPVTSGGGGTGETGLLPFPKDFASLLLALSTECHSMVSASIEKKVQVKVVQRSIEYVNKLYSNNKNQTSNSDVSPEKAAAESPPTSELKKSLSNLSGQKHRRQRKMRRSSSNMSITEDVPAPGGSEANADPLSDMLYEVNLSLKQPPRDVDEWNRFATVCEQLSTS
jgi:hypothetical protein